MLTVSSLQNDCFAFMIRNVPFTDSYTQNTCNCQHSNLRSIGASLNGRSLHTSPINVDFSNEDYLDAHRSLFVNIGKLFTEDDFNINKYE